MVKIDLIVQKINSISATFNLIVHKINSVQRTDLIGLISTQKSTWFTVLLIAYDTRCNHIWLLHAKCHMIIYSECLQLNLKCLWMSRRNRLNTSNSKPRAPQQHACAYFKANVRDSEVHVWWSPAHISLIRFMRSLLFLFPTWAILKCKFHLMNSCLWVFPTHNTAVCIELAKCEPKKLCTWIWLGFPFSL